MDPPPPDKDASTTETDEGKEQETMLLQSENNNPRLPEKLPLEVVVQVPAKKVELRREIGLFSAVCLIISVMIGSGIFISPSKVLEKSGSVGFCLVVWGLCGLISYLGALSFGELGTVVGESGAEYAYFQASYAKVGGRFWGSLPGFIYIWLMVLFVRPAEVAILVLTFSEYIFKPIIDHTGTDLSPTSQVWIMKGIGVIGLGLITYINFRSVKWYVKVQNIFSSLKIVACIIVIVGGIYYLAIGHTENLTKGFEGTNTSPSDLALAFYHGLWAYDGWTSVTVVTEEIKSPHKNIPWSISIAVPLITVLYFMMNLSYMSVLTDVEMIKSKAVAIGFAERILGHFAFVIPVAVVLSTFGCALSVQFGVSRLCFSSARNGHMVEVLSYIHTKRLTPAPAVLLQGLLSLVFIAAGDINHLIEFVSFLIWIFYGMAMISLLILRKTRPDAHRPYRVPIIIPIFVAIVSIYLALVPLILSPSVQFLIAVGFILLGVAVYYPIVYRRKHPKFMKKVTRAVQNLFKVGPPDRDSKEPQEDESNIKMKAASNDPQITLKE